MTVLAARPLVVADSALDLIGSTPMVRLSRFAGTGAAEILAKCEFLNPGGSVKDRIGVGMIRDAEEKGLLKPGGTIIEPTAGNTGIGLALVGVSRGYRVILCVPEKFSIEKQKVMAALGGSVVQTPDALGMKGAIDKAHALAKEIPGAYVPQQFANPSNPRAHYETTGPEILEQCEERLDAIVIGAGSTGTFMGVARFLAERLPDVLKVAVEPQGSILGGGKAGTHKVEGIGASFLPEIWDPELADEIVAIDDEEAFATVLEIARTEGLLVGGSSGCNAAAARRIARRLGPGKRVVTLLPDGAERYVSKGILG
ncbi:MAG TPA: cysteine synthase family protein [Thermoanaerobaculia bacterium]|jgi:cysteine synthase A|nr:cysteine synthase family protein [Thermoanaerobaculia bacterium]